MNFYENQITGLLGHNGAGKVFFNIFVAEGIIKKFYKLTKKDHVDFYDCWLVPTLNW